jgi:hypothetical protein
MDVPMHGVSVITGPILFLEGIRTYIVVTDSSSTTREVGDHKEVSTTCNANADWFEYAGGNEYGQCAKELDRKGHDKVLHRDISIPQRCCPRLRVRQVFPPSFCNGYATLVLS